MRTLQTTNDMVDDHEYCIIKLEDELRKQNKTFNVIYWCFITMLIVTFGMTMFLNNRLTQAEKNIAEMGKDLIYFKDLAGDAYQVTGYNERDIAELICDLKDKGLEVRGVCYKYDDAD